jgi:hypothetical protein
MIWLEAAAVLVGGYATVEWARERFGRPMVKSFAAAAEQAGPLVPRPVGLREIPVAQIVGSVDRWQELAADFRPRGGRPDKVDDERYRGIEAALRRGLTLPPIVAYALDGDYYVLDGHHRVAAARALGQAFLDADVIEYRRLPRLAALGADESGGQPAEPGSGDAIGLAA